ncbi:MAG: transketolase C-terminal domain-containing protein [Spirochaetota bacterium]
MIDMEKPRAMRDVFIAKILEKMRERDDIMFVCADFGSPVLDKLRAEFPHRFMNVGIAEQNLINVSTGLALEGFSVYAYAIAPFATMRCYEQIRVNLALLSQIREMNVNIVGVGAGFSYEVSGPTHHCLEDMAIMQVLPNFKVVSPADWVTAESLVDFSLETKGPKYFRFDAKPLIPIYKNKEEIDIENGFVELHQGQKVCIVSTGYMTHKSLKVIQQFQEKKVSIGLIDLIKLKGHTEELLLKKLNSYDVIITVEEGFINKGGLDNTIASLFRRNDILKKVVSMGLQDRYIFHIGSRENLHAKNGVGIESIVQQIESNL